MIGASEVVKNVSPIGEKPATESQARPLARVRPEKQAEVWQEAVKTAPEGKVTAVHVETVVRRHEGRKPKPKKPELAKPVPYEKAFKHVAMLLRTFEYHGGIAEAKKLWSRDDQLRSANMLEAIANTLTEWVKILRNSNDD